ncbi:DUF4157 domain-containing protein [Schlegelella sp. S2-27]|uniref:DUF4157 domain-containing protein n=1 Tax=Caldimonas mangrovi TaxID=2944811 RepID=A0ABT0YQ73_9BURK|nr:DUF4157 domain-containing protein [Caldimonas mangrovi]MCM5680479.1 DUF4157 domain-containing protein [Caldimonas mangrovi]
MKRGRTSAGTDVDHDGMLSRREAAPGVNPAREAATGSAGNRARSGAMNGARLDPQVRADMEARFGTDFGDVRVHDDGEAHACAADLGARAFTVGHDIAFAQHAYAPHSATGRRLLAHELAHVVQQRRGGPTPALSQQAPHEQAADAAADQVAAGATAVHVEGGTAVGVACAPVPKADDPDTARRREVMEREAQERQARQQAREQAHAELVLALLAFRRHEYRFGHWYARMAALEPGVVWSATMRLLGPYGFGMACKVSSGGVGEYLKEFDFAVSIWAQATRYRYLKRGALSVPIFDPEGEEARQNEVILDELPDGTGYIGRRRDFLAVQDAQIKERNARVAENIAANVFGAVGWGLDGEEGSEAGAALGDVVFNAPGRGGRSRPRKRGTGRGGRGGRGSGRSGRVVRPRAVGKSAGSASTAGAAQAAQAAQAGVAPVLAPAAGSGTPAVAADPLVAVPIQGRKKGVFFRQGTPEFGKHAGTATRAGQPKSPPSRTHVVMPESQARQLGFRAEGEAPTSAIEPRRIGGLQVESAGAGRQTGHPITARTSRQAGRSTGSSLEAPRKNKAAQHGFDRTIKADIAQSQGHNALIDGGELGVLRPNNVSTPGVDSITAVIDGNGNARIYLNDFTTPGTRKGPKPTHDKWRRELLDATAPGRMDFGGRKIGGVAVEDSIRRAIAANEVYVRPVKVSLPDQAAPGATPTGGTAAPTVELGKLIRLKQP